MNQQDMLRRVDEAGRQFDAAIAGLDEAALGEPGVVGPWSIKDLIGHVTAWEQLVVDYLERRRRGEPPLTPTWASMDEYNAREAARRQGWTLAQVREEAAGTRRRLQALLAAITDDEWVRVVTIDERERPLGEWIGGALNGDEGPGTHAAEHARQIQSWRATRAATG